jgi:hypothetical protein
MILSVFSINPNYTLSVMIARKKSMNKPPRKALMIEVSVLLCIIFFGQHVADAKQSSTKSSKVVIHHPGQTGALITRWKWALAEAEKQKFDRGFWIGYSIEREMNEEQHMIMGEVSINDEQIIIRGVPLNELLAAKETDQLHPTRVVIENNKKKQTVKKQIAILFQFANTPPPRLKRVGLSDINMPVSFHNKPLLWLGTVEISSSLELIRNLYSDDRESGFDCPIANIVEVHGLLDK